MKIRRVKFGWEIIGFKRDKNHKEGHIFHIFGGRKLLNQIWRYLKWKLNI